MADRFTFTALHDPNLARSTSKKINFHSENAPDISHFRGALLQLFGPPLDESDRYEEAFQYVIEAKDERGATWILTAYQGPSGPAIGGKLFDDTAIEPANALANLIAVTSPTDFEATVYDEDTDHTVTYGITNGQYFYHHRQGHHATGRSA